MGPMIPKEMKYNLYYGKVRGDESHDQDAKKKVREKSRASSNLSDFHCRNKDLTAKLLIRKEFSKF